MRAELATAVQALLAGCAASPRERTTDETDRLIALATFVVRARSAVERDGYSREIELVPAAEVPTRLVIVLDRLLGGLNVIGAERDEAWRVVTKAALDSVPALRLAILYALVDSRRDTNAIAEAVRHPAQTTRRALEDLTAHDLVDVERQGDGKAHVWELSTFARQRLDTFPKCRRTRGARDIGPSKASPKGSDISGRVLRLPVTDRAS